MLTRCACNACRYGDWEYHYVGRPAIGYWSGGWGGCGPGYWGNSYYPGMPVTLSVCAWHAPLPCSPGASCAALWESVCLFFHPARGLWNRGLGGHGSEMLGKQLATLVCRLVFVLVDMHGAAHALFSPSLGASLFVRLIAAITCGPAIESRIRITACV